MFTRKLRFFALLAILLTSGFLFTSFISYFNALDTLSTQIEKTTLPLTSDNIYSEIQRDLLRPIFISSMMAKDTFVRDWVLNGEKDADAIIKYLKEIQTHYGTVTSFFVSEKSRQYYHPSGQLKPVNQFDKQDTWYFRVQKMQQDYEINVDTDTANRASLTVFINHRVYDYSGNYIGAIGVGLAVEAVKDLIENYKNRYGRQVYFIDKKGELMLRGSSNIEMNNIYEVSGLSDFASEILSNKTSAIEFKHNGSKHYLNSRFVPEFNWYLIVSQKGTEAEQRIQNTLLINLGVSFVISLFIIILVNIIIVSYQKKLETMATTDKLTNCANRQVFDVLFKQAKSQSKRRNSPLSAVIFDIDYFKQINDTYGHPTGDVVLKTLIQTIQNNVRDSDLIFRWGGDEFLILLPESDAFMAFKIAEKIREKVVNLKIAFAGQSISVTISVGVASMNASDSEELLIENADKALYIAKNRGRNCVEEYKA